MLIVVPAGILTVEQWSERIAAVRAGPSSPPELFTVHVPWRFEIDGKRLTVLKSLPLEETAATMYVKRMTSSSTQRTNLITIMVDNVTSIQEQV
jgi:hypothetical protein